MRRAYKPPLIEQIQLFDITPKTDTQKTKNGVFCCVILLTSCFCDLNCSQNLVLKATQSVWLSLRDEAQLPD
jgi:hypothetical protein